MPKEFPTPAGATHALTPSSPQSLALSLARALAERHISAARFDPAPAMEEADGNLPDAHDPPPADAFPELSGDGADAASEAEAGVDGTDIFEPQVETPAAALQRLIDTDPIVARQRATASKADGMSAAEIAAELAQGRDPYSEAQGSGAVRKFFEPVCEKIAPIFRLCHLFGRSEDLATLFHPGNLTEVIVPLAKDRKRYFIHLPRLLDEIGHLTGHHRPFAPRCEHVLYGVTAMGRTEKVTRAGKEFHLLLDAEIALGRPVLAMAPTTGKLSDAGNAVSARSIALPPIDRDMVVEMLRFTHSVTGCLAEEEIRSALPSDLALKRMSPTLLNAAFCEGSTICVARRLAELAGAMGRVGNPVTLDDVAGLGDHRATFNRMLSDLRDWQDGKLAWREVTSSALFYGPAGNGKTMLASAIAGSAGIPLIATSYADCQRFGHMGDYLREMNARVEEAIASAPAVFFIDELDSFRQRSGEGHIGRYMSSVVNGLLEQLSKLNDAPGVLLLAATNHPKHVDPAVIRPGRFDLKLKIGPPDRRGIKAILAATLGDGTTPLYLSPASDQLLGASGAAVASVAREALGLARADGGRLEQAHLAAAVNRVAPPFDTRLLHRIARHEAGHILAALLSDLPDPFDARLSPLGGEVRHLPDPPYTEETAFARLRILLAGRAAEILFYGAPSSGAGMGVESDLARATELALDMLCRWGFCGGELMWSDVTTNDLRFASPKLREHIGEILATAEAEAGDLLIGRQATLDLIADELMEKRELTEADIALLAMEVRGPGRAIDHIPPGSNVVPFRARE